MKQDLTIEMASEPRLLSVVRDLVRSYLMQAGFSSERVDEIVLGVDEACTNAIRHACAGKPDSTYRITFRTAKEWLEIQLEDSGEPASPDSVVPGERPDPADASDLRPGGLGLHLIHEVFDQVDFCPGVTQGNCVTMKLKLPKKVKP